MSFSLSPHNIRDWVNATGLQKEELSKTLVTVTKRQGYYLHVLSWSSLNIDVFWSFTKTSVERKVKFEANLFQTKLLSPLSRKACHLLCSSVLLHKFTFDTSKPKNTVSSKFQYESGTTPHKIMPQCVWEKKNFKKIFSNLRNHF